MHTTRTISAAHLSTCKALMRPFTVLENSTLNQKFNLHLDETPRLNEYPVIGYLAIGNKGVSYENTSSNFILTNTLPHLPSHAALYNHIPFAVRRVDDDFSAEERSKYRMRVPISLGGVNYVAYYLLALTINNVTPAVELRNVTDGVVTTTPFVHSVGDLSPTPPPLTNIDLNNPDGDYLSSTGKVDLTLNQADLTNIMDACAILYGDARYAVINEMATVSGIDRVVQGVFGNTTSNYLDVVCAQVNAFIYQDHSVTETTTGLNFRFDLGSSEQLLT